ncbi:MAG TPA: PorT family protein [Cytophagales bacterium]|jgi:hypothetical protein|nr:PorT family protein [Cytophagales bacterium]
MKNLSKILIAIPLLIFMLTIYHTAQSQIIISLLLGDKLNSPNLEFGIEGGLNRSFLSGIEESEGFNHFHLGFYFDIRLKNDLWLNTGVRVKSNVGARKIAPYSLDDPELDAVFLEGHINRDIRYWYVPVHLKYRFGGNKQFFVNVGGQIGLRNKADDIFYNTVNDKDDVTFKLDIRDHIKRIDAGLSGGLGYKFKGNGMNLGATYYLGLTNIMKTTDLAQYDYASRNSSMYIYLDIPIGAGYRE